MPKVRLHRLLAFVYQGEGMLNLCGTKKAFKKLGDMSAFEVRFRKPIIFRTWLLRCRIG